MVTKQDIMTLLENSGISSKDIVAIHCSLRAIGPIENGADGLIDAFCEYLSDGLLLIATHTWSTVNRQNPFYDVNTTPPCVGVLSQVAVSRPDAVRSLNPIHSMAGFGKRAAEYLKGEEKLSSPAPVGCALSRLYEENGKVLLLGVGLDRNTYLHTVDERLQIPNRFRRDPFIITIRDKEGNLHQTPPFDTYHTEGSPVSISEFYPNYKKAFEHTGAVTYSHLGNALVYCCDARKMTDTARLLWERADYDLCIAERPIPEEYYRNISL